MVGRGVENHQKLSHVIYGQRSQRALIRSIGLVNFKTMKIYIALKQLLQEK